MVQREKKEENLGSLGWSHKSNRLYLHSLTHLRSSVSLWRSLWRGLGHKELRVDLPISIVVRSPQPSDLWQLNLAWILSQSSLRTRTQPWACWLQACILSQRHTDKLCLCCMALSSKWEHSLPERSMQNFQGAWSRLEWHMGAWVNVYVHERGWLKVSCFTKKGPAQHGWLLMAVTSLEFLGSLTAM